MSFLLPTVDHDGTESCYLEPDQLSPDLLCTMGLSDTPAMPIYALWSGSDRCVDLLLSAIADEATNRSLASFACRSPSDGHYRRALWVEGIGLLRKADRFLPSECRLIDLSALSAMHTAEDRESIAELKRQAQSLRNECQNLGKAIGKIEETELYLTAPYHQSEILASKAARIASAQPIGSAQSVKLPILSVSANEAMHRLLPFGEEVQIIGLRELYGVAAHFLLLLSDVLTARSADSVLLTDQWSGSVVGIWLPSSNLCYLTDPPERRQKLMTISRYLSSRPQDIRTRYRTLVGCRSELYREIARLTGEINEIQSQISEIEDKTLQKKRLGEFRKRLLIELFCK